MELALNSLRLRVRDAAFRAGLPRFWRWWTGELAPLVPAAPRGALQRRLARPVVEFGDGEAIIWRPELADGVVKLTTVARVPLTGDAAAIAAAGRAAIAALASGAQGAAPSTPRVMVTLPPRQVLRKDLILPAALEENLDRALAYDLDRHTPFRPEQVYFDAAVIDRDPAKKTIRVDWAAALKTVVDAARKQVEDWGASVVVVTPGPASAAPRRLNLLPEDARPRRMLWRRWQVWAPLALVAAIALAVVLVPLVQKREYAIALLRQTEDARAQAESTEALMREFERLQGDYNYALAKKYAYPGTVQIIDDVTRVLPDDTWLTQFEMKTTVKGKEMQREVFLRGESANGSKLISLLEDAKLVEQAALRSPTTKLQPGPGEVFDLGAQLKATAPPAAEELAGTPPASPPSASPPSGSPPAAPPPSATPTATAAPDAAPVPAATGPAAQSPASPPQVPAPSAEPQFGPPPPTPVAPPAGGKR